MRPTLTLLLILLLHYLPAAGQPSFSRDIWLNDANIPVKVNAMTTDGIGYIWLATDEGLYRFNGRKTTLIPTRTQKPVTAVAALGTQVLVGNNDGTLATLSGDSLLPVTYRGYVPEAPVSSLLMDGSGVVWICTEGKGFYTVVNNTAMVCNSAMGLSDDFVYNLFLFPGMRVVVSTDQGINEVYLKNHKLTIHNFTTRNGLPDNIVRVIKPMPDDTPCWLGTQEGGLAFYCRKSRKVWTPYIEGGWHYGQVNDILPMGNGRAWVATDDGYLLNVYADSGMALHIQVAYRYTDKKINKLLLGRSGVVWCATNSGLTMVTDEYMQYLPVTEPYRMADIRAMVTDRHNNLWYSQDNKLYRLPLTLPATAPQLVHTTAASITGLYADKNNHLWIGTFGSGLYHWQEGKGINQVTNIPVLKNESILDVSGDDTSLWISGLNGVSVLRNTGSEPILLHVHNKKTGIGSDYVYQVYHDSKGRKWMATDGGGVTMYDNGKFRTWGAADSFASKVVYCVTEDAFGRIWVNTLGNGLYMYNNKGWQHLSQDQGLQDVNVQTIAANATGQLVAVHSKGIDIWYPGSVQFRNYNRRQGIQMDSTSAVLKLAARDTAGNVYIPSKQGFIIFKNITAPYAIRPLIHINAVSIFFRPVSGHSHRFSYQQNHISFRYEGINFANPDKLHYRYKLDGYGDSWITTNDESVTFPQLSPGRYTFRVQASLNNSFSKENEAEYSFTITRPFWQEVWFIVLMAGAIAALVYIYVRNRERNLRKLSSLQRERLMFEYEHLKSQVNPHFLFNSLNTLASLIEEDKDIAVQYTTQLSDLYRNMLTYRDKDLVLLSEEWGILHTYFYIQQSRFGNALQIAMKIPDAVMNTRKIVPLALQLLVENAIKHNIASRAQPLTITIEVVGDELLVRNPLQPKMSKEKGAGLGLVNIKKRYALITDRHVSFGVQHNEYIVILPLL